METQKRTLLKAITWQSLGVLTMTLLALPHTGSLAAAMTVATSSCALGFITFFVHERLWSRVSWGTAHSAQRPTTEAFSVSNRPERQQLPLEMGSQDHRPT
ncbi:DUF2061 domain-containing protein [Labrenzia sp. PHM005]|uniref:DUF2061 domain-containing protein n=1 Tax=Labrenzia sp. PHM005 TaxID=2590016 RepID=UPI00113FD5CD|nr:DUF2061 domain-containing protein [Labrenzia sp. PHM005]QDG79028.1 DUF2061 domain-containing protein [Labrenzia sp. PHM005]